MAVTKDDTTQGAVAPKPTTQFTPPSLSPTGQSLANFTSTGGIAGVNTAPVSRPAVITDQYGQVSTPNYYGRMRPSMDPTVRFERQNYLDYLATIQDQRAQTRLSMIPHGFLQENPWTSAWLVFYSGLDDNTLTTMWPHIGKTWGYLRSENPAYLVAKARALYLTDPVRRAEALDLIDNFERAGAGLTYRPYETAELLGSVAAPRYASGAEAAQEFLQRIDPSMKGVGVLGQIGYLSKELAGTAFKPLDVLFRAGLTAAAAPVRGGEVGAANILGALGFDQVAQELRDFSLGDLVELGARATGYTVGRATDILLGSAAYGILGPASGSVGGNPLKYMWPTDTDPKTNWWHDTAVGNGVGIAAAEVMGFKPGTNEYDNTVAVASFWGQFIIGAKIAKAFAGFKAGGEALLPEGGISPEVAGFLRKKYGLVGEALYRARATKVGDLAFEDVDGIRLTLNQLRDLPPTRWDEITAVKDVFNDIHEVIQEAPSRGEAAAVLMETIKVGERRLDPREAWELAGASNPVEATLRFENMVQGKPNLSRLPELEAKLANVQDDMALWKEAYPDGSDPVGMLNIRDLMAEEISLKMELEAARSPISTRPVLEIPRLSRWNWLKTNAGGTKFGEFVSFVYSPFDDPNFWLSRYKTGARRRGTAEALEAGAKVSDIGEKGMRLQFRPMVRLSSLMDDVGATRFHLKGATPAAEADNIALTEALGRRGGLKPSEVRRLVARHLEMADLDSTAFYAWRDDLVKSIKRSNLIAPNVMDSFLRISEKTVGERQRAMVSRMVPNVDGKLTPQFRNVLEAKVGKGLVPKPPFSSYLLDDFYLPFDDMLEATNWAKSRGRDMFGNRRQNVYWGAKAFMHGATLLLKPLVLVGFGLRVVPLAFRIMGEERVRAHFALVRGVGDRELFPFGQALEAGEGGYVYRPVLGARKNVEGGLKLLTKDVVLHPTRLLTPRQLVLDAFRKEIDSLHDPAFAEQLGQLQTHDAYNGTYDYDQVPVDQRTWVNELPSAKELDTILDYYYQQVRHLVEAPEVANLIQRGPEGWAAWIKDDPVGQLEMQKYMRGTVGAPDAYVSVPADMASTGSVLGDFAQSAYDYISEVAGHGNRDLMDAIAGHGTWNLRELGRVEEQLAGAEVPLARNSLGESPVAEYQRLTTERDAIQGDIHQMYASGDYASAGELMRQRRSISERLSAIEREGGVRERATVSLNNKNEFLDTVRNLATQFDGEGNPLFQLPRLVRGKKFIPGERGILAKINNKLYAPFRKVNAPLDTMLVRGPTYSKIATETYTRLKDFGWSEERAHAAAYIEAAERTKALFYDLSARSSLDRTLKDVFWFLPAWRETMKVWFHDIPTRYYWPVGMAYIVNRVQLLTDLGKDLGWLQKDEASGDWLVTVPFLGDLLDKIEGGGGEKVPGIVRFNPKNLSFLSGGGFTPGLSTQWNIILNAMVNGSERLGQDQIIDVMHTLSDILQPYGQDVSIGPPALNAAYTAITGNAPFWEVLSSDHQRVLYNLGAADAMKQARVIVGEEPDPFAAKYERYPEGSALSGELTPEGEQAYRADTKAWTQRMLSEQKRLVQAAAMMRLIGATLFPTQLRQTDEFEQAANPIMAKLYPQNGEYPDVPEARALIDAFLEDHPEGWFYLVPKTRIGEKATFPYTPASEDEFWQNFYNGQREALSPEDFLTKAAAFETYRTYVGRLEQDLRKISPDLDVVELLTNGFDRQAAYLDFAVNWQQWQDLHPDYAAYVAETTERHFAANPNDSPTWGLALKNVLETKRWFQQHAELFSTEGIPTPEYKKMLAELGKVMSSAATGSSGAKFEFESEMNWYYDNIVGPYYDKLGPLYDQIRRAGESGTDAGGIYDEIRRLQNEYGTTVHNGHSFPSPEEVAFSNRTPEDQAAALLGWGSRPPEWLSDFQLRSIGISPTEQVHALFDKIAQGQAAFDEFTAGMSPSSTEYDDARATRDAWLDQQATAIGPDATHLLQQSRMTPFQRLIDNQQLSSDTWGNIGGAFNQVVTDAANAGVSVHGWSQAITPDKVWFYTGLATITDKTSEFYDAAVANDLERLSFAFPLDQGYRRDVLLWDALFFGNFHLETPLVAPDDIRAQFAEAS